MVLNERNLLKKKITLLLMLKKYILLRNRRKYNMWMRRTFMERSQKVLFNLLVKDLKLFDSEYFF